MATAVATSLRERLDRIEQLRAMVEGRGDVVTGVPSGAVSLLAWWLRERTQRNVLVITTDIEPMYADVGVWDAAAAVALFPAADTPPFDRTPPSEEVTRRRLATLASLGSGTPLVVVASPQALLRPTLTPQLVRDGVTEIARGARTSRDAFLARLVALGYRR